MNKMRRLGVLIAIAALAVGVGGVTHALKAPHDYASLGGCNKCHARGAGSASFAAITSFDTLCLNSQIGCHIATKTAQKKALTTIRASNRFKNIVRDSQYATYSTNKKQSSHGWKIPNTNSDAGATVDWHPMSEYKGSVAPLNNKITCTRCHRAHGDNGPAGETIYRSFLKANPKGDNICFQCHVARRIDNVRASLPADKHYSHPVEVNYSSIRASKPEYFETTPALTAGYNESARPRLYTTIGGVKGAVVCSTCHGPLHAADSNPYTFDNLTSYNMRPYSSSAGNLLRQYPMSKPGHENNLCKSCHKVSLHKSFNKCSDCHEPHKKSGDKNLFLIKTSIMTPYGKRSVKFESTSTMASRWNIYSGSTPTDKSLRSKGICQVCHRNTNYHRAYSTTGAKRDHNYLGGSTNRYKFCPDCHKHVNANSTGAFKSAGCSGCHNDPPTIGKHSKHVGSSSGLETWKWSNGTMTDARSDTSYGFSCGRCHNPWTPYTATQGSGNYEGRRHFGIVALNLYTADIGFKNNNPLPDSSGGSYIFGTTGAVDQPGSYKFRTPADGFGVCSNLYCHGQFYGGYTSNNPNFSNTGTQSCVGSCHGTNAAKLPGVNGTGEWGAHRRHIGNANSQQYGTGANFRCNACHYATASLNNETTITSRVYHVNGRTNVKFAPSYESATASATNYGGYNPYTTRTNTVLTTKTQFNSCVFIYCHSDGSRTQGNYSAPFNAGIGSGAAKYPNWSSIRNFSSTFNVGGKTFKRRCSRCHGNSTYVGITSAMPGYATRPGKGNAHQTHIITNRILCYACHSNTVGTDNRTINTAYHVNKTYNVDLAPAYGGTWNNSAKRCSNVKCHGQKLTPPWDEAARCQDCHFTSTGVPASNYTSEKKGYNDNYKFRNFTVQNSMPRIYSSEWKSKGHGSPLANKVCDDCHASTFRHLTANVANNPYRLDNSDTVALCQQGGCHPTYKSHTKADMDNYGNAVWAFNPKCVDCHDPHSDSNRKMVKRFINFTTGSDAYGRVADPYANNVRQVTFTTVGSNTLLTWSSFVKADYSGICQRCHNTQAEVKYFRKYSTATGDGYTPSHNAGSKCTNCHLHTAGFKPKACSGCHFFPPKDSGAGSDPNSVGSRMKHTRHVNWTSPYVDKSYDNLVNAPSAGMYNFACKKCHFGNHASDSTNPRQVEVLFDATAYPKNASGAYVRFNGWTETGAEAADNYDYMYSSGKCSNLYCHGNFAGGKTTNVARFDNTSAAAGGNWSRVQRCGACHGAKATDAPSGGAHGKHVSTYALACKNCHRDVASTNANGFGIYSVTNKIYHVDGKTRLTFYTTEARIGGTVKYRNSAIQAQATTALSAYSFCQSLYCHSKGTNTLKPYTAVAAYPNYTAKWDFSNLPASPTEKCSYCHGSRKTAGGYAGITSAMPNYPSGSPKVNSHKKHVVDNGFNCSACHAKTVKGFGTISSINFHVNKVSDVYFPAAYSGVYNADKSCSRVKCHGKRRTPAWGGTVGCTNCHFSAEGANDADIMDYSFRNYSKFSSVPKIYSGEWMASGHGKSSGSYNMTNNQYAGKICNTCHVSSVKHNTGSNFFRLTGLGGQTDPSTLCKRCHGTSTERFGAGMGNRTGIQSHTQQILSSAGYANLTTWRFKPKCTDCHDPHGDAQASSGNISMIRNTVLYNFSGSDSSGRPIRFPNLSTVNFVKFSGTTSFDDNSGAGKGRVCAVCHKRTAHNGSGTGHTNAGLDCRTCHKHKQGFNPSGCTGCHGDDTKPWSKPAPPKGPTTFGWRDSLTNMSSLHLPHAYNPNKRPGFGNQTGFACTVCHGPQSDGRSEAAHPGSTTEAGMGNMTTGTAGGKMARINFGSLTKNPVDDTCLNTKCHTPRSYTRTWKKPINCDDCHGYTRLKGSLNGKNYRAFNLQTTQSHKIHINWTGVATPPASWKKNYKFACSNCHYDPANNYSTHYSGQVNMTSAGPVNTKGGQFYSRGKAFEGFTSGNESLGTCSKTYCHGNFTNGTTTLSPNWKKGVTTLNCGSCHKAKTAKVAGWGTGTLMPAPHPTHVNTATYNFTCARCHNWTVQNNTTVQFTYSTHVNTRKDVNFDNTSGAFTNSSKRMCQNNYCHSSGQTVLPRTVSNYTADWLDGAAVNKTGAGKGCSYCHGSKGNAFGGITAAMPNYANQAHAKHARNATSENFRCYVCHAATVNPDGTINYAGGNHVNKFKNISIIATYKSGQTGYSTTVALKKTCKNIKCHGGRTTPLWTLSTGINCMDCHKSTTGDTDKRVSNYKTFQGFSAAANTVPKIYSTQWADRGHGRSSGAFPVSGNTISASKVCTDCHGAGETRAGSLSTRHGNTANNPFRLFTAPTRPNTVCNRCHGTGGSASKNGIMTHASSVTGQGHNYEIKCIDCHDPHGDNNGFMFHSSVVRPPDATAAKDDASDQFGRRYGNVTGLKNVDFTAKNYTTDYAKKTQASLVCQVCHNETQKPRSSTQTRFRWSGSQDLSHGTDKCTGCHSHSSGFKGIDCDGCHGMPPINAGTRIGGTFNPGEPLSGSNTAGGHQKHVTIWGASGDTCSKCHYSGMWSSGAKDDDIEMAFSAFSQYTGGGQDFNSGTGAKTGFYGVSGVGVAAGTDNRCVNMKCHGGGWLTSNLNNISTPVWSDTAKVKCGNCHGAKKAAGSGSWPTTNAHAKHVGTGTGQLDYMCKLCHNATVQTNNTGLNYPIHVNAEANFEFYTSVDKRVVGGTYDGDTVVNNNVWGKCKNTYCHSLGTDLVQPYDAASFANLTARWNETRGGYKKPSPTTKAKCNYCHGNTQFVGVTSAMPNYTDGSPKANKHFAHVRTYNFLCTSCHVGVTVNNTSIDAAEGMGLHVNRAYNVKFNTSTRFISNSSGTYTYNASGGRCETTYCHSKGTNFAAPYTNAQNFAIYTAEWGDSRGSYFSASAGIAKCNYCHGSKSTQRGMTSAMPAYVNGSLKANRHQKHVITYGFTCTRCHVNVTVNNSSIDASGGASLHVNKKYNVNFNNNGVIDNTQGTYTLQTVTPFSKCKNTYCHSRGTDTGAPFSTRTSFANFTARWGDNLGGYKQAAGLKAKCNYCHGNRLYAGMTSAMPNYSTQIKPNSHKRHVVGYGFTCKACHKYVTNNNSSIDVPGGITRHANKSYNVDFSNSFNSNTGVYIFSSVGANNKCKNMYCHSRGTDFTRPYSTRTSFANFTARWGDNLGGYKQAIGLKSKCNYCHGDRRFSGITAAMPNYSGNVGYVMAKANSHRVHVIGNGFTCKECHYGVVPNNTSISDRVRHTNAFYNISFAPGRRNQAGKMYSSVWGSGNTQGTGGGTCKNVKCHGGNPVKWGDTVSCRTCHFDNVADNDKFGTFSSFRGSAPKIYSADWGKRGHGAKNKDCLNCHNSTVQHNDSNNPFRLFTSDPNALCGTCHGISTERSKWGQTPGAKIDILTHSKANTGGDASWNNFSTPKGKVLKCVDCHDPHGDKNYKMMQAYINHTGSDKFGRPAAGRPWTQLNAGAKAQMTYTTWGSAQAVWSSFANGDPAKSICRRCHTPNSLDANMGNAPGSPNQGLMTKSDYNGNHQSHQPCTNCHAHSSGFKGGGESTGAITCDQCHSSIFTAMKNATNGYHHVLSNTSALAGQVYRNVTMFGPTDMKNPARRCLMCHVDHDVFSPANNASRGVRAKNLRIDAAVPGVINNSSSFINTDFWPAKRKNSVRTGGDAGSGNYSSTFPVSGKPGYYGVCMSCHKNVQRKNTSAQIENGTAVSRNFAVSLYTSSSHNFQIIAGLSKFADDNSTFRSNCTKCHNTNTINQSGAQGGLPQYQMALHDQNTQSLLNNATSSQKPKIEQMCYICHSQDVRGSYDYYSSLRMSSGAKMIKTAITAKTSGHPVESDRMAGRHKIDEFYNATGTVAKDTNPPVAKFWNFSTSRHVECVDCHNTHGGNANVIRNIGGPFYGKQSGGTYANQPAGNLIAGAQKGAWGVQLNYTLVAKGGTPRFTKASQINYQYELCLKCHSNYAYGANPRGVPSQLPDETVVATAVYGNLDSSIPQANIAQMINPKNYGFHPIYKKGRNQPPKTINTAKWPSAKSNWMYKDRFTNKTAFMAVSGLSWTFVPPYSQHSLLACSDCHQSDNTGNAAGRAPIKTGTTPTQVTGTWTNADEAHLKLADESYATIATASAKLRVQVQASGSGTDPSQINVVAYGFVTSGTNNQRKYTLAAYSDAGVTLIGTSGLASIPLGSNGRFEWNTGAAATWATLNGGNCTAEITATTTALAIKLDYLGLEAIYKTSGDVRGPHGSLQKWILTTADPDIQFDANNNNNIGDAADKPNAGITSATEINVLCYNCHRRDVYGAEGSAENSAPYNYSRMVHPAENNASPLKNVWGIWCMNCHAGGGIGEIHGSFASSTSESTWGGTAKMTRPRGVRLMNGAIMNFEVVAGGTKGQFYCYTPSTQGGFASATCTSHGWGGTGSGGNTPAYANYLYTTW